MKSSSSSNKSNNNDKTISITFIKIWEVECAIDQQYRDAAWGCFSFTCWISEAWEPYLRPQYYSKHSHFLYMSSAFLRDLFIASYYVFLSSSLPTFSCTVYDSDSWVKGWLLKFFISFKDFMWGLTLTSFSKLRVYMRWDIFFWILRIAYKDATQLCADSRCFR